MLYAANIVPQIGKVHSKSGTATLSYQITHRLPVPNWDELPGQSEPALVRLRSDAKSSRITAQSSSSREASL
jgi:hypothetical protein